MSIFGGYGSRKLASLARVSAHRPIHVILACVLLAAVSYLTLVDEYLESNWFENPQVSFYHPATGKDYNSWVIIEDSSLYPKAEHLGVTPLLFKRVHGHEIPQISNSYNGLESNEKVVISNFDAAEAVSQVVAEDGTLWKAVHQYRIGKYQDYIKNAYSTLRSVIQGAETYDIVTVTIAYLAMYYTFFRLFYDMSVLTGSKFWLGFAAISSSLIAFLLAFASAKLLGVKVSFFSLSEGIPFLVATVGFNRIVKLSSAVLNSAISDADKHSISSLIYKQLEGSALNFVKDQILCAFAFVACSVYAPHLEGLKNFCILSALIMVFDILMTFSYYSAVLALKIEINRIRRSTLLKEALEEEGMSELLAEKTALESLGNPSRQVKASSSYISGFKLFGIVVFFGFHIYLLGSNWVFDSSADDSIPLQKLSKNIAKHVSIGPNGTIVTLLEPKIYVPKNALFQVEDLIVRTLEKVSLAIRDRIISKTLLFFLGTSAAINIYLLNAARAYTKPVVAKKPALVIPATPIITAPVEINTGDSRPLEELIEINKRGDTATLSDDEVTTLVVNDKLPLYALEKKLNDTTRAVVVRRKAISKLANSPIIDTASVPYLNYDYNKVFGACCENVIGFIPLPLGVAGPLLIDGKPYHIPMATTEGCLVASTMRGCKAINAGGGVTTVLTRDGMTRGPCVRFPSLKRAGACKIWLDSDEGQTLLKKSFDSTSRFARLQHVQTAIAGSLLYIRFRTTTGDAMGMNMISKGVEFALKQMVEEYGWSDMDVISVSGNFCTDKKAAAINWTSGRGKSVVAEAIIPGDVVRKVLKSDVDALVELNISKNLIGSAMAGSIGGFNAHAANLVTAVFLACGQDPAQNVESSNCITLIDNDNGNLKISVSMPSIEVGTIGGGTILGPQNAMLELLGVKGPHPTSPGANAHQLAKIVASAVLAAELSLCSALAAGHLVQSHMQHNRPGANAAAPKADVQRLTEGSKICIKS